VFPSIIPYPAGTPHPPDSSQSKTVTMASQSSESEPVPELTISPTTSEDELLAGHKLITDSVAQQRATIVRSLLYGQPHLTIPPYILFLSWLCSKNNIPTALLFCAGCTIAILSAVGRFTDGYIAEAEKLGSKRGYEAMMKTEGHEVVVARWGPDKEVIGVAVVKVGEERGVLKALAVRLRYRKHGVGRGLLEEAVRVVRAKVGAEAPVVFADHHPSELPTCKLISLWSWANSCLRRLI
jgi:GNAT superfamily N-acetyltransferase